MTFDRLAYSAENCSIRRTLDVVGEKWTLLVIRDAFYGVRRFDDFHRAIGCARNILAARLATLVEHGILERHAYREPGSRPRFEYRLTDKGRELYPALVALKLWGDRWMADPEGAAVELRHKDCGAAVGVALRCTAGHGPLVARDVVPEPGPAAIAAA
jgi:DNA-binding HxlR family transcriptional regulator